MAEVQDDILQTIPDDDLPNLRDLYKTYSDKWPFVHSFISTQLDWKQKGEHKLCTFMSPNHCWKEDGTFIALMQFGNYDVFFFTLDQSCSNLCLGLKLTKRISWKKPTVFFNVLTELYAPVVDTLKEIGVTIKFSLSYDVFCIQKQAAINFDTSSCPSDVYIKELDVTVAPYIDSLYKAHRYRYPDGDKFIETLIKMNTGYGVFSRETDELLAWVMKTCLGQIGFLQTRDEQRKKGYASMLTKIIAKDIAEKGFHTTGTVSADNAASQNMFRKLGFSVICQSYFAEVQQMS